MAVIRLMARANALDPRLLPTERHLQRWAVSQGSGLPLPSELADILPRTKLPPLPDDQAVVTDQAILHSPRYWQRFVHSWYRSPKPAEVIAGELGLSRASVYDERRLVLAYFFGRLTEAGIPLASFGE
jgi:hypothetical protein